MPPPSPPPTPPPAIAMPSNLPATSQSVPRLMGGGGLAIVLSGDGSYERVESLRLTRLYSDEYWTHRELGINHLFPREEDEDDARMPTLHREHLALAGELLEPMQSIEAILEANDGRYYIDFYDEIETIAARAKETLQKLREHYEYFHPRYIALLERKVGRLPVHAQRVCCRRSSWITPLSLANENLPKHIELTQESLHCLQDSYHELWLLRHTSNDPGLKAILIELRQLETKLQKNYDIANDTKEAIQNWLDAHQELLEEPEDLSNEPEPAPAPPSSVPAPPNSAPATASTFSTIDEEINRGHARAATDAPSHYTTGEEAMMAGPPQLGSVRRYGRTPRVFSGSFSIPEEDFRDLWLDTGNANQGQDSDNAGAENEAGQLNASADSTASHVPSDSAGPPASDLADQQADEDSYAAAD